MMAHRADVERGALTLARLTHWSRAELLRLTPRELVRYLTYLQPER